MLKSLGKLTFPGGLGGGGEGEGGGVLLVDRETQGWAYMESF